MSNTPLLDVEHKDSYNFDKFLFLFLSYFILIIIDCLVWIGSRIIESSKKNNSKKLKEIVLEIWENITYVPIIINVITILVVLWASDWIYLFKYGNHKLMMSLMFVFLCAAYALLFCLSISEIKQILLYLAPLFYVFILICIVISGLDMVGFVYNNDGIRAQTIQSFRYGEYLFEVDYNEDEQKLYINSKEIKQAPKLGNYVTKRTLSIVDKNIKSDENIPLGIYMFYYPDIERMDVALNICIVVDNKIIKTIDLDDFRVWYVDSYVLDHMNKALQEIKNFKVKSDV